MDYTSHKKGVCNSAGVANLSATSGAKVVPYTEATLDRCRNRRVRNRGGVAKEVPYTYDSTWCHKWRVRNSTGVAKEVTYTHDRCKRTNLCTTGVTRGESVTAQVLQKGWPIHTTLVTIEAHLIRHMSQEKSVRHHTCYKKRSFETTLTCHETKVCPTPHLLQEESE